MGNDLRNYSLRLNNTFGIEAKCRRFVEPETEEDLIKFLASAGKEDRPLLVIGEGSNMLFTSDYPNTVVHPKITGITIKEGEDENVKLIRVGCSHKWDEIAEMCVKNGLYGAENLSFIPGEAGASAVQNIGAYGAEAKDIIYKVEAIDTETLEKVELKAKDCGYSYRKSKFKDEWKGKYIITYVTYRLTNTYTPNISYGGLKPALEAKGWKEPTAFQVREVIGEIRRAKLPDPKVEGNAGSFFMNPLVELSETSRLLATFPSMPHFRASDGKEKIPAAWLIEECGWKGREMGKAAVSDRQALVIVNKGGATGKDIMLLANKIADDVERKFGIRLKPEVNIIP